MRIRFGKPKQRSIEEKIDFLTKKIDSMEIVEEPEDVVVEQKASVPVIEVLNRKGVSDLGKGVVVPTKDVIRGLQRLHEAKPSLFELLVKVLSIASFALFIVIIILLVR